MIRTVAVDTNVLLDFLFKREPGFLKVSKLFDSCKTGKLKIFVPDIVFPELEWVVRSFYKQPKAFIIDFIETLLVLEGIVTEDKNSLQQSINLFRELNIKFTDAIILTQVEKFQPDEFLTFDEDLQEIYQSSLKS